MRWIFISPHFDDAILSCGGLIATLTAQSLPVELWTLCAGDPPEGDLSPMARNIHRVWGTGTAPQTVLLRREEDRQAAANVFATVSHFPFPDCIYRRSPAGDLLYPQSVFTPWHPLESHLSQAMATALAPALQPTDQLVCPLGIGGHVDHLLVRRAVESLGRPLHYYADVPYVLNRRRALAPLTVGLATTTYPVAASALQAWLTGIAAYRSQMTMLFVTTRRMRQAISRYWQSCHGLRLYTLP